MSDLFKSVKDQELPDYAFQFLSAEYNRQYNLNQTTTEVSDSGDIDWGLFAKGTSYMSGPGSFAFWTQRQYEMWGAEDPEPGFDGYEYFRQKFPAYKDDTVEGQNLRIVWGQLFEMNKLGEGSLLLPSSPAMVDALVMDGLTQLEETQAYYGMMDHLGSGKRGSLHALNFLWQFVGDPTNLAFGIGAYKAGFKGLHSLKGLNKNVGTRLATIGTTAAAVNFGYEQLINEMNPATELEGSVNEWYAAAFGVLFGTGFGALGEAGRAGVSFARYKGMVKRMSQAEQDYTSASMVRQVDEMGNPVESMGAAPSMTTIKGAMDIGESDLALMMKQQYGVDQVVHTAVLKPKDAKHPINKSLKALRARAKQEGWIFQELEHPDQAVYNLFEELATMQRSPGWNQIATRSELDQGAISKMVGSANEAYAMAQRVVAPGSRQVKNAMAAAQDVYRTLSGSAHTISRGAAVRPLTAKRGVTAEGYTHLLRDKTMKLTDRLSKLYRDARKQGNTKGETGINYDGQMIDLPWMGGQNNFEEAVVDYIRKKHGKQMGMDKTVPEDVHPLILEAAKEVEAYYTRMGKEMVDVGLLSKENELLGQYYPVIYDSKKIKANPEGFVGNLEHALRQKQKLVNGKMVDEDSIPIDASVAERMIGRAGRDIFEGVEAKQVKDIDTEIPSEPVVREPEVTPVENPINNLGASELDKLAKELESKGGKPLSTGPADTTTRYRTGTPEDVSLGGYPGKAADSLVYGNETKIVFSDNSSQKAYYAYIESSDLKPSNNPLGARTSSGGFPKNKDTGSWNHRADDYADPGPGSNSIKINDAIVKDPNYAIFYDRGQGTQMGPPVIAAMGYPDSGANRTMAIQRLYDKQGGAHRVQELKEAAVTNAADFGINPSVVADMSEPVLVRVLQDPGNPGQYSSLSNLGAAATESQFSSAMTRAAKIQPGTMDQFARLLDDAGDEATFASVLNNTTSAVTIRNRLIKDGAWTEGDLANFWNSKTDTFTSQGRENVQSMMRSQVLDGHNAAHPFVMEKGVFPNAVSPTEALNRALPKALDNVDSSIAEFSRFVRWGESGEDLNMSYRGGAELMKSNLNKALIAHSEYKGAGGGKAGKRGQTIDDWFFGQEPMPGIAPPTGYGNIIIATIVNAIETMGPRKFRNGMKSWLKRVRRDRDGDLMGLPAQARAKYKELSDIVDDYQAKGEELPDSIAKEFDEVRTEFYKYEGENPWTSFVEEMGGRDIPWISKNYQKLLQPAGDHKRIFAHRAKDSGETGGQSTISKYYENHDSIWDNPALSPNAERAKLQETWIDELINLDELVDETQIGPGRGGGRPPGIPVKKEKKLILLTGPAGVGKSASTHAVAGTHGAITLDVDILKRKMPEFYDDPAQAASVTHVESQVLGQLAYERLLEDGTNIVYPKIGSQSDDFASIASKAKAAGYEIHMVTLDLPLSTIMDRVLYRWGQTGRMIPIETSVNRYSRNPQRVWKEVNESGNVLGLDGEQIPVKTRTLLEPISGGDVPARLVDSSEERLTLLFKKGNEYKKPVDGTINKRYNTDEGIIDGQTDTNVSRSFSGERRTESEIRSSTLREDGQLGGITRTRRPGLDAEQIVRSDLEDAPSATEWSRWEGVTEGDLPTRLRDAYRRELIAAQRRRATKIKEEILDPTKGGGGGMSPHLMERTLGIDYDIVSDYLDNQLTRSVMRYDHKTSGEIGIRKSIQTNPETWGSRRTTGGKRVKTPEDLKNVLDREFNVLAELASREGDTKLASQIEAARNKTNRDLFLPMDALRGRNPGSAAVVDPDSFLSYFGRTMQRYNFVNKLGSVAWAQLNDVAPITLDMLIRPQTVRFIPQALKGLNKVAKKDLEIMGLWADNMYRTRAINDFDFNVLDHGFGGGRTRQISAAIEQASGRIADVSGKISGMNFITNANKRLAAMLTLDKAGTVSKKMIRADKLVKGGMPLEKALKKVRLSRYRAAKVNQLGFDVETAMHYHTQVYNHGVMSNGRTPIKSKMSFEQYMKNERSMFNPNFVDWADTPQNRSVLDTVQSRINDEVNRHLVVTPGIMDRPLINFNTWGKMFNQFQTFMISFLHQRLIPMAQMPAQNQLWYMGMYLMIGSLTDGITNHMSGRRTLSETADMWEENPLGMTYKAWVYSGLSGPINRLMGITDALGVPVSPGVMFDNRVGGGASQGFYWGDPGTKTVVQALGPTGSTAATATDVLYDVIGAGEVDETTAYRAATLAPFQNQALLRALYRTTGLPVVPEAIREK